MLALGGTQQCLGDTALRQKAAHGQRTCPYTVQDGNTDSNQIYVS